MKIRLMKKSILFLFLISILSCKKDPSLVIDYRSKYLGNYDFATEQYSFSISTGTTPTIYTNYTGKITKGQFDDRIIINYEQGQTIEAVVDNEGKLNAVGSSMHGSGAFDSNAMHYDWYTGGLGGGTYYSIKGTKR
jgi:hypothetical protein